jgi:hypothetical protein
MKQTGKIALGGVLGAVSVVCMLMTVIPTMTYALPAVAGLVLMPTALEAGVKWGWLSYVAVAILTWLFAPSMEAKMMFVAFFGYYPVLRLSIETLPTAPLRWVIKLAVFNASMVAAYLLLLFVLGLDPETFVIGGVNVWWLLLVAGNVVFFIYDFALRGVIDTYWKRLHPLFMRIFRR